MKSPTYLLVCAILGLFANQAQAASTSYTVKIAIAIPFDFRDTGSHYKIPVLDENTPISITVKAEPSEDLQTKIRELSSAKIREIFSDIKEVAEQLIPLTTEPIAAPIPGSTNSYLSLWLAPAVPQTKKGGQWYTLGHIKGIEDNTDMLNKLFGLDLLKRLTESIDQYFSTKPPLFRYVFLFAQNRTGEVVVAYTKTDLTNIRQMREAHRVEDYEYFGLKAVEQTVLTPTIDLSWYPPFLLFYIKKSGETQEFSYPYYYCTAVPAEVISAKKPAVKFSTISELKKTKANGMFGYLLDVGCSPLYDQKDRVIRPKEPLITRAAYEINALFNKLYLKPFAESLYRLAV